MPLRFACFTFILLLSIAAAQVQTILTVAQLQNGQAVELDKLSWKYSPNDDPRFADPQFDDRAWATLANSSTPEASPSGWRGIGWFRLHLRIAPELANEEIAIRALPLGGMKNYQYQQQELTLAVNDVVVLMSDGLPERFNANGEMLEEQAAKQFLVKHTPASAQELITGLAELGDDWGGARPQDDDVTFVVLKLKGA